MRTYCYGMQTIAVLLTSLIAAMIPDTPKHIKTQIHREAHITNQIILQAEWQNQQKGSSSSEQTGRFRKQHGLDDRVLRDMCNRLAETDEGKQPSTALPVIGFYSFEEEDPLNAVSSSCDRTIHHTHTHLLSYLCCEICCTNSFSKYC
ncbi:unnamed protein product [Echinostoma caproni]|uniref:Secreted protein n=1 Tax=Echinostoma caproni TaxID=27848 RepID=A0A183B8D3_9TREM|nr:unnamed protein product [Echinostoma caproni]